MNWFHLGHRGGDEASEDRTGYASQWFDLTASGLRMSIDAPQVIAFRLAKLGSGDPRAGREASLMVEEKFKAIADSHLLALKAALRGEPERAAGEIVDLYQHRIEANKRRLNPSPSLVLS